MTWRRPSRVWWAWLLWTLTGARLLALPDPDRRLFSISETHGPGAADLVGALVLTIGWAVLDVQIWRGRRRLLAMRRFLLLGLAAVALTGAVLVVWSVERDVGMWWLAGAGLLAGVQLVAAALAAPRPGAGGRRRVRWRAGPRWGRGGRHALGQAPVGGQLPDEQADGVVDLVRVDLHARPAALAQRRRGH